MPSYLTPGVYIEEVSGAKPIAGVGTATGAFIGIAEKGPLHEPKLITNLTQFRDTFGEFTPDGYLAEAVTQFFIEGGTRCYVVRTAHHDDTAPPPKPTASSTVIATDAMQITAISKGTWGDKISIEIADPSDNTKLFKLIVKFKKEVAEIFDNLNITPNDSNCVDTRINGISKYIEVEPVLASYQDPTNGIYLLTGGDNGITGLVKEDFLGINGLEKFNPIDDINILAIPDSAAQTYLKDIIIGAYSYCENRKDLFFVADPPYDQDIEQIVNFKKGTPGLNSSFAALYYPWIKPLIGDKAFVPPSGAIVGTYSATDIRRGVHKAPAGVIDGYLNSAVGLGYLITHGEQESLNPIGINAIRSFPASGINVWGARTLSADPEWRYVNIRRLFMFVEESIEESTQWVVFEPNRRALWQTVKRDVSAFLRIVWLSGALFGATEEEAFFVKIDDENNPPATRDAGQLIIDVGIAPVKPAEFVIFRISQKTLEA